MDVGQALGLLQPVNPLACLVPVGIAGRGQHHAHLGVRPGPDGRCAETACGRLGEHRTQIIGDHRQYDLRLGIAEPDIELDHLRAIRRQHEAGVKEAAKLASFAAHSLEHRNDDVAHDPGLHCGIEEGAWCRPQRDRVPAVREDEERRLASLQMLLDDEPRPGVAEAPIHHHRADGRFRLLAIRRDGHSLPRREAVRFQDDGERELAAAQDRQCFLHVVAGTVARRRDLVAGHEPLGKDLAGFQAGSLLGGTAQQEPVGRKQIGDASAEWHLGPHDRQPDLFVPRKRQGPGVSGIDGDAPHETRDSGVAGSADNLRHVALGRQFPDQGMLPTATTHHKQFHGHLGDNAKIRSRNGLPCLTRAASRQPWPSP